VLTSCLTVVSYNHWLHLYIVTQIEHSFPTSDLSFSTSYLLITILYNWLQMELCIMLLECCSQERTYLRYYGLLGQRFCMINKVHQENFEKCFVQQYSMIHRLETNKLRNVAKFFAHLLGTDALPWHVLSYIRLTEEDTTSSSRIFIKILFQVLRMKIKYSSFCFFMHLHYYFTKFEL